MPTEKNLTETKLGNRATDVINQTVFIPNGRPGMLDIGSTRAKISDNGQTELLYVDVGKKDPAIVEIGSGHADGKIGSPPAYLRINLIGQPAYQFNRGMNRENDSIQITADAKKLTVRAESVIYHKPLYEGGSSNPNNGYEPVKTSDLTANISKQELKEIIDKYKAIAGDGSVTNAELKELGTMVAKSIHSTRQEDKERENVGKKGRS